jgi:HEPN domain-containing protein
MKLFRGDFQTLADMRAEDARILLAAGRYAAAFYMCGYAVECALKACIAKQTREYEFPDLKQVRDSYTHDARQLIVEAKLKNDLDSQKKNSGFERSWNVLLSWSEIKRYEHQITHQEAQDLYIAVTDSTNGVLTWLKNYW